MTKRHNRTLQTPASPQDRQSPPRTASGNSLLKVDEGPNSALYRIVGDHEQGIRRYLATTSETREVCNRPEILGTLFTTALRRAVVRTLLLLPERHHLLEARQEELCVVHFQRGDPNFGVRDALHRAYGLERFVFFTLGSRVLDSVLTRFHRRISRRVPSYRETIVVYFEGRFELLDSTRALHLGFSGKDLLRQGALLSPEFALS